MSDWIIEDHALERWRERIHPAGTVEDILARLAKARRLSKSKRRQLRRYWEAHGQGGVSRVMAPAAPSYILATESVCFVIWAPGTLKTVYRMPGGPHERRGNG